jgi:hypothetical protein
MNCENCTHYDLYKILKSGKPFGYAGNIPCLVCSEYNEPHSEFIPKHNPNEPYAEIDQLKADKRELLEALKEVIAATEWEDPYNETDTNKEERINEMLTIVKAAINKAEGK